MKISLTRVYGVNALYYCLQESCIFYWTSAFCLYPYTFCSSLCRFWRLKPRTERVVRTLWAAFVKPWRKNMATSQSAWVERSACRAESVACTSWWGNKTKLYWEKSRVSWFHSARVDVTERITAVTSKMHFKFLLPLFMKVYKLENLTPWWKNIRRSTCSSQTPYKAIWVIAPCMYI